ncbi:polysaccharide pyruvyl transferase family protein [Populibacterium corticicola]|uniref:Polysaccharide pyruvyl transferase family protein n=1 Tax=Populibacterium corticicola TaxID=1812826 RepID=A0ABW5XD72_9MICO
MSTRRMGGNAGNLLYGNGVARTLASSANDLRFGAYTVYREPDLVAEAARINENYDHFVIPMANSFRASYGKQLTQFTELIKMLDIPVTLVGVGAQATADSMDNEDFRMSRTGRLWTPDQSKADKHNATVRAFCEAILERSSEIGVRGAFTKAYLESVGIPAESVRVIGCPSVYTWGPGLQIQNRTRKLNRFSRVSMNIDYRVANIDRVIAANMEAYPRLTSPSQDAASARMILTGKDQYDLEKVNLGTPVHTGHPMYAKRSVLYYSNPWGWIESFKNIDFTFGARLHGNIASILGGTPAHLLAHDSRTTELADFHGIPYTRYDKDAAPVLAGDLVEKTDYTQFNTLMQDGFDNFIEFLHANNLTTIYDTDRGEAPAFDAGIAAGKKIGAERPASQSRYVRWIERKAKINSGAPNN